MKNKKHKSFVLFFILMFSSVTASYAGTTLYINGGQLQQCKQSKQKGLCSFNPGEAIYLSFATQVDCNWTQRGRIYLSLQGGREQEVYNHLLNNFAGNTWDFILAITGFLTGNLASPDASLYFGKVEPFNDAKGSGIKFYKPGNYQLRLNVQKEEHTIGGLINTGCRGSEENYYWTIKEPPYSRVSINLLNQENKNPANISKERNVYYPPYNQSKLILQPTIAEPSKDINQIAVCKHSLNASESTGKVADISKALINTNNNSAEIDPRLFKPGEQVSIYSECSLTGEKFPGYIKNIQIITTIHRNNAAPGKPRFTLEGGTTTATDQYANWGAAQKYNIGVTTDRNNTLIPFETCTIKINNGEEKTYDYNHLPFLINSSDLQNSCTADAHGDYKNCGATRHYSGTCEIGSRSSTSPYHAYPVKGIPIQNNFSITVFGPRITKSSDFYGRFVTASPDGSRGHEVRPGAMVMVDTRVQLTGKPPADTEIQSKIQGGFPYAIAETRDDKNLKSSQCLPDWAGTGNSGCSVTLTSAGSDKPGKWALKASDSLMERTEATLRMYGSNHDGNINSQSHLLAEKKITITPLIRLAGTLQTTPAPDALKDKVYHHGRKFTVPARYTLTGYNQLPDKPEQRNDSYRGKLTALQVTLDKALSAGNNPALTVNGHSVTHHPHWDGHSQPAFMADNSPAELAHDQHSELQIPLTVTRSSHDPSPVNVTVTALGSYTGDNVDVTGNPALQPSQFSLQLGPDLYPATEAFHMEVNNSVPLRFAPGQTEPLILQVDFNNLLTADRLATPEGIEGTIMQITLPPGLKRSEKEPIQFICNDGRDCRNDLKNNWDGKEQRNILQNLLLKPTGTYRLRIPLIAEHNGVVPPSSIKLAMSQSPDIDQDTIKRIVAWESVATVNKPVEQAAHQDVAILPLNYKEQTIEAGNKMTITVGVKNGQKEDTVTLQADGSPILMQYKDNQGAVARFTSTHPLPLPEKADYSLQAMVESKMKEPVVLAGPALDDPRQLSCRWKNGSNLRCTFSWQSPLPFVSGNKLLSYQALNDADKQLTGSGRGGIMTMEPAAARNALLEQLAYMNADGDWTEVLPFNLSSGKPQGNDTLPQPAAPENEQQSLFTPGALPARGTIKLSF